MAKEKIKKIIHKSPKTKAHKRSTPEGRSSKTGKFAAELRPKKSSQNNNSGSGK